MRPSNGERFMKRETLWLVLAVATALPTACSRDEVTGVPDVSAERLAARTALTNVVLFATEEFGVPPQLSVVNPDGTALRRITTDGQEYGIPSISPDGERIAFSRFTPQVNGFTIFVMNADGTGQTPVIHRSPYFDEEPVWSPDGNSLAFSSWNDGPFGPYSRIYIVNVDGTGLRQLSPDVDNNFEYAADFGVSWSPDGTRIVFTRNGKLQVINADGSGFAPLANDDYAQTPWWSPDGGRIAYASAAGDIHIRNADGSHMVVVTSNPAQEFSPRWSPDGRRLVFVRVGDDFVTQLYTINVDGTGESRLSTGSGFSEYSPDWGPARPRPGVSGVDVEVNPATATLDIGESRVLSAIVRSHGGAILSNAPVRWSSSDPAVASVASNGLVTAVGRGAAQIRAAFGNDTGRAQITVAELTLRNRIVFATTENGSFDLGIVRPDGSDRRILTSSNNGSRVFLDPDISPDGRHIAYRDVDNHLYVINADGTGNRRLVSGPDFENLPDWSPDGTQIAFSGVVSPSNGSGRIFVVNVDGTGLRQISPDDPSNYGGDGWPSWAPDGTRLTFTRNGELFVINADGTGMTHIATPHGAQAPAWSPDGRWIAYQSLSFIDLASELYITTPDGSNSIRLTNTSEFETSPSWSPDSRRIVFARWANDVGRLYVINVDGTGETLLTAPSNAHGAFVYDDDPSWSPLP
jgi:Tol biopolymer transport system component